MKRFYKQVDVVDAPGGFQVMLDGRAIKTARGQAQIVPGRALALAMANEWDQQGEEIDPAGFMFRHLADYAIDVVLGGKDAEIASILPFAQTDTLCYRAAPDEPFHLRQQEIWEDILRATEKRHGLQFVRISGIMHMPQPPRTLEKIAAILGDLDGFTLAGAKTLASLSSSMVVTLAALENGAQAEALWNIANLEEDWQAEQWGQDMLAQETRARKFDEFSRAMEFIRLAACG